MKIAILGTRGIPNRYGGFEQFAEYLSVGLVSLGHTVTVYNSHSHPYRESVFNGVNIKHIFDPENKIGTAGQFVYDALCILDTHRNDYDVILQLGYTSSSVFFWMHPRKSIVITNMDGLEWKRTKYSRKVQKFLEWAESLAVKWSDFLISDSIGIQNYLKAKYNADSVFIPYGSHIADECNSELIKQYGVDKDNYDILIARLEPENNIEVILDGVVSSRNERSFIVVGNYNTKYGTYIRNKFTWQDRIKFLGGIYDINVLNALRFNSYLYFHGHTVGGTNPSLLEAMGSASLICAHENEFNSSILGSDAFYFRTKKDVAEILDTVDKKVYRNYIDANLAKISNQYNWQKIINSYSDFIEKCLSGSQ